MHIGLIIDWSVAKEALRSGENVPLY